MNWKAHFSHSFGHPDAPLHFAAHSHHAWPDVSFMAQQQAWLDAARLLDDKWHTVVAAQEESARRHVARHLNLPDPHSIVFAQNTHELLVRLLSCFAPGRPLRILGTDSEFHSFARQIARLEEEPGLVEVTRIATHPFTSFPERFVAAAQADFDLVWLSQVFFNSGYALPDLNALVNALPDDERFIVIDGYHAFMALPVDLSAVADRIFYLAGGYKYAMAGEGCCFLHAPPGRGMRPLNSGWYAAFAALETGSHSVGYAGDARRFQGATFDPTALYRFNAVMDWLVRERLDAAALHQLSVARQQQFLRGLAATPLAKAELVVPFEQAPRSRFLAFRTPQAPAWQRALATRRIITDCRGDVLRLGFTLYHEPEDVEKLLEVIASISLD